MAIPVTYIVRNLVARRLKEGIRLERVGGGDSA